MYNHEWKQQYIMMKESSIITAKGRLRKLFDTSEIIEKRLDRDLCQFNKREIMTVLKEFNTYSINSLNTLLSSFKDYTDYCLASGMCPGGRNHCYEITITDLERCVSKRFQQSKIITRSKAEELCAMFPNPRDGFTILSLFEFGGGKSCEDLFSIKRNDIDEEHNILHLNRGDVSVTNLWIQYARAADGTQIYHRNGNIDDLQVTDTIYKPLASQRLPSRYYHEFAVNFKRMMESVGVDDVALTSKSLTESGIVDFAKRNAINKGISIENYVRSTEFISAVEKQYNKHIASRPAFLSTYRDYL